MKFLENANLGALSSILSFNHGDVFLQGRIECYSCKMLSNDKKLYKDLTQKNGYKSQDLHALSPVILSSSPPFISYKTDNREEALSHQFECPAINSKTLFNLTLLLNTVFPDYDFSHTHSEEFTFEPSLLSVVKSIDDCLSMVCGEKYAKLKNQIWSEIDKEIYLDKCQIFSYQPSSSSDPFYEDGIVWSFIYFFFNAKMKRFIFFSCQALSSQSLITEDYDDLFANEL